MISIGQAGENQVKLALALIDGIASMGKGGLGAVMGSKNLKAVIVNGTKQVKIADHVEEVRDVPRPVGAEGGGRVAADRDRSGEEVSGVGGTGDAERSEQRGDECVPVAGVSHSALGRLALGRRL